MKRYPAFHQRRIAKPDNNRLRDELAMAALQGIIGCYHDHKGVTSVDGRSDLAYRYADEMLRAREAK